MLRGRWSRVSSCCDVVSAGLGPAGGRQVRVCLPACRTSATAFTLTTGKLRFFLSLGIRSRKAKPLQCNSMSCAGPAICTYHTAPANNTSYIRTLSQRSVRYRLFSPAISHFCNDRIISKIICQLKWHERKTD